MGWKKNSSVFFLRQTIECKMKTLKSIYPRYIIQIQWKKSERKILVRFCFATSQVCFRIYFLQYNLWFFFPTTITITNISKGRREMVVVDKKSATYSLSLWMILFAFFLSFSFISSFQRSFSYYDIFSHYLAPNALEVKKIEKFPDWINRHHLPHHRILVCVCFVEFLIDRTNGIESNQNWEIQNSITTIILRFFSALSHSACVCFFY